MSVFGAILTVVLSGFLIGALGRLAVPGPDPMPFWLTVLIGLAGAALGGAIAAGLYGASHISDSPNHVFVTLLLEIGVATAIVAAYRRFVQRRPLSGPDAHHFPTRGFGIARMRARLLQLGVDPDRIRRQGRLISKPRERSPNEVSEELEKLRDLRDKGVLTDEEYEKARERLRRY